MNTTLLPNSNIWIAYGGVLLFLVAGSGITRYLVNAFPDRDYTNLRLRVRTWWMIVPALIGALTIGPTAIVLLFAIASAVTLHEYLVLTGSSHQPVPVLAAIYAATPILYALAYYADNVSIGLFIPLYCLLLVSVIFAVRRGAGVWRTSATVLLGVFLTVFCLSYIARLVTLSGGNGLVLFLLMITQLNDVSQYISGKMFGRTPLAPTLSPNKTREGMLGGLATTAVIASFLGPLLTPLSSLIAVIYGTALALAGVAGDLTVSAIKRMAGVKDAGKLLPGHGGFFDRVDSLIYTRGRYRRRILVWQEMQPY